MNSNGRIYLATVLLLMTLAITTEAEVVYTPVNVSIGVGDSYNIDLNHDGVVDFALRSHLLEDHCQSGDGYIWTLNVSPANGNAVVTASSHLASSYASALHRDMPVNSSQSFYPSSSVLAQLSWGLCGTGTMGEWLNIPDRYLGVQFRDAAGDLHYGWAKVSSVAYVDQWKVVHASTLVTGFAYETLAEQEIVTGHTS
jgi:hypothetical protein